VHPYQVDAAQHQDAHGYQDKQPEDEWSVLPTDLTGSPHGYDSRIQGANNRRDHERHRSNHQQNGDDRGQIIFAPVGAA
jgi:hypothetical protein